MAIINIKGVSRVARRVQGPSHVMLIVHCLFVRVPVSAVRLSARSGLHCQLAVVAVGFNLFQYRPLAQIQIVSNLRIVDHRVVN
jgi:hypothetical protein